MTAKSPTVVATTTSVPAPKVASQVTVVHPAATSTPVSTPTPAPVIAVSWNTAASTGYTVGWANVRNGPSTASSIVSSDAPGTAVSLFGTAAGESFGAGTTWYRVSDSNSSPEYIYGGLISLTKPVAPTPTPAQATSAPSSEPGGQVIDVNMTSESMVAYQDGKQVFTSLVTTGRPELSTPTGTYHIYLKETNVTFISPWPQSSPYYYSPLHINYALEFLEGGFFIHDAPWRNGFGPGTQVPHTDTAGKQDTGSHGCVELPLSAAAWIYNWAQIGTTVIIHY